MTDQSVGGEEGKDRSPGFVEWDCGRGREESRSHTRIFGTVVSDLPRWFDNRVVDDFRGSGVRGELIVGSGGTGVGGVGEGHDSHSGEDRRVVGANTNHFTV